MKRKFWIAWIFSALLALVLRRLYTWLPCPLTGVFSPAGPEFRERLKAVFWPFLLSSLVLTGGMKERPRAWSAFLAALLLQPVLLAALAFLFGLAGWTGPVLSAICDCLTLGFGFTAAYGLYGSGRAERLLGLLIVLSALYGAALVIFSLAAPKLPNIPVKTALFPTKRS